uniref:Uncharacterized protein n=1 Tax=Colobus angolensis palliatus TaxID=336983 RepID=A0A2K5J148_COLAP
MTQESRACSSTWKEFGYVGHCSAHRHFQGNSKQSPFPLPVPRILRNWLNSTLYGTFCGHLRKTS